jgi:cobalamin biosynthesis Mg chelatase CobN
MTVAHEPSSDSDIEITGVRVEQAGGRLTIRGSTSNVGTTNASSLVVTVADGARVGPAESESSYFVGAVQQSDFKSFQVDARLTAESNQTISIPLDVRYQVDGHQVAETITVSYTPRTTTQASQSQRDSSVPVALVGGVALLVLVGGFAYRRYR